ncbi:uncharacterized protein UV8b_01878 [Ustilaginoidea virens]|uniref:Aminoglycoside phosphotransferase domain-containing protein n=1 Tax=Ustilaginoidea virens TaxID=1159556 RepID=A0A1B5KVK5_USTVR|nr:uncharacterized protein UV8b_01878 [Ustilaginoidea virens]QUC17637.1 hypothetical protein UV8b_01878 [Ustilaginoidea virens]GAO14034.1 hypothetical protein UVI_02035830 [Ustilaginoidea virens]
MIPKDITFSAAADQSRNFLHCHKYPQQEKEFFKHVEEHRSLLSDLVAHHFAVNSSAVTISGQEYWRHGSFNLVIPTHAQMANTERYAMLRFPLPYRVGEATCPGNSDEKVRCEAGTYAWLHGNCPSVPIPQLYGFGLSTNERFTRVDLLPWWSRWLQRTRCYLLALFGCRVPSDYVRHDSPRFATLDIGYLLIETISNGEILSETWDEKHDDARLQKNLHQSLARIMLSLTKTSFTRIGSFRLDSKGYLHLDNRPLSVQWTMQENEGIPLGINRDETFSSVDDFVLAHVTALDNRLLHQPNAIEDSHDAHYQMTSLAAARAMFPRLFRRDLSKERFVFALTDLHRSNIFVDEDWNVSCIIDLEFSCTWPIEFLQPPYWLRGDLVDEVEPATFGPLFKQFVETLEMLEREQEQEQKQEQLQNYNGGTEECLSSIMRQSWPDGPFWVTMALKDAVAFTAIFYDRILPICFSFSSEDFKRANYEFFGKLWNRGVSAIIETKLQHREVYLQSLREALTQSET